MIDINLYFCLSIKLKNARIYNPEGHPVNECAKNLENFVFELFADKDFQMSFNSDDIYEINKLSP